MVMELGGWVYIMSNYSCSTLYIGVTTDLVLRVLQHKQKEFPSSFSAKYHVDRLVYYEFFEHISECYPREKQLKSWNRDWKNNLIIKSNFNMDDLFLQLLKEEDIDPKDFEGPLDLT
jgi:putative endonuclease